MMRLRPVVPTVGRCRCLRLIPPGGSLCRLARTTIGGSGGPSSGRSGQLPTPCRGRAIIIAVTGVRTAVSAATIVIVLLAIAVAVRLSLRRLLHGGVVTPVASLKSVVTLVPLKTRSARGFPRLTLSMSMASERPPTSHLTTAFVKAMRLVSLGTSLAMVGPSSQTPLLRIYACRHRRLLARFLTSTSHRLGHVMRLLRKRDRGVAPTVQSRSGLVRLETRRS